MSEIDTSKSSTAPSAMTEGIDKGDYDLADDERDMVSDAEAELLLDEDRELRRRSPAAPLIEMCDDSDSDSSASVCSMGLDNAKMQAERIVQKVLEWNRTHFSKLPHWLQDNDYLHHGHRPPLPSVAACFKSIFAIHTETGNIWTHLIGCCAFLLMAIYFFTKSHLVEFEELRLRLALNWEDRLVFSCFFLGAISCLGLSFAFHTLSCHSQNFAKLFSKLDYCGISLMIMGSFVPWLFYGFYCRPWSKITYMIIMLVLGSMAVVVSLWDKFGEPQYRAYRAGLFIGLGLSGLIPCVHYLLTDGFQSAFYEASFGWLVLMAALYITGALLYAFRVPERFFPGKCDIWFHSHQIFHVFVVGAAYVHYHGITQLAITRLTSQACADVVVIAQQSGLLS